MFRIDKRFFRASTINRWLVVSFADRRTFPENAAQDTVRGFLQGCRSVGKRLDFSGVNWSLKNLRHDGQR